MANVYLIGVRGIPNRYGGFERLVEVLAPHLVSQGHNVTVFCNQDPTVNKDNVDEDLWMGGSTPIYLGSQQRPSRHH